jgi:hypothetical protein
MKKIISLLFTLALAAGVFVQSANADATKTVGATGADYTTLKLAFDAINAGTITGAITLQVVDNTTETMAAVLNASLTGSASYTSVLIYPTVTGKTISGNLATPLIDFSGADNVTIDGRVNQTGNADLIITNTSTANTAGTSTIRFISGAINNTVKYCTIKGSEMVPNVNAPAAGSGVILFSTTTDLLGGNSNNTIDHNNITCAADANRPLNAIYSLGTLSYDNVTNTISNNNIYNFLNTGKASNGICLASNTSAWTISDNNFYETTPFTATYVNSTYHGYYVIYINNTGVNYTVSGNYIGGSAADHTGTWTKTGSANMFMGIYVDADISTASNLQGNTISNINWTNTLNIAWYGIWVNRGAFNIGTTSANIIGAATGTGSITVNTTGGNSSSTLVYGMVISGNIVNCQNNIIGSITSTCTDGTKAAGITGIYITATTPTVRNNTIGSTTTANSINATSASTASTQNVYGIDDWAYGASTISGNTIANLSNGTTNTTGVLAGINYSGSAIASTVSSNFIRSLSATGSGSTAGVYGIKIVQGATTYSNNIISLGENTASNVYGIYETGASTINNKLYFNTVYIGGAPTSGTSLNSYALYSAVTTNDRNFRNNIFYNARSNNGATGKHYAAYFATNPSATRLTEDYNDYYAPGTDGGTFGYFNGADVASLADWKTATGQDAHSLNTNPGFTSLVVPPASNYMPSATLNGVSGTGIIGDYYGNVRSIPKMGALESASLPSNTVDVYNGATLQASYLDLTTAFAAINAGTHTGVLTLKITGSQVLSSSAILNKNGSGSANYTSVNIYPTVTGLSINGNLDTPLFDFNGANNVTLDGRVGGTGSTKDLIISNASTSSTAGTSTIRFINDASTNTVKYCTINGSTTDASSGILFFSTGTATGNINNTIDNNNITNYADLSRPLNAVYSSGSSVSVINSGNIISNNNIYDFLSRATTSNGIQLAAYNTGWTISGNSFYETASFAPTTTVTYTPINISALTSTDITISGNFIGGSAPSCGTTGSVASWTKTNAFTNTFNAINLNVGPTVSTTTSVQGNTIKNFTWGDAGASAWTAINIPATATGAVNVGTVTANTIGATTGNGSIVITAAATGAYVYGINIGSTTGTGAIDCQNNIIGAITAANAGTLATNFYGIRKAANAGATTISNNTIGSVDGGTSSSINASSGSTSNAQVVYGILSEGTGTVTISGNTISKLTNGTTNGTMGRVIMGISTISGTNTLSSNTVRDLTIANAYTSAATVIGISQTSTTAAAQTITGNTIYNLSNTYASAATISIIGINYAGSTVASSVNGNFIYNLSVNAGNTSAKLYGINIASGATTYANNIISLGGNTLTTIYGIYETGIATHNNNLYFNTVYIGGAPASGTNYSYALYSAANTNTRDFRNNIFSNTRSTTGGSNLHYAAYITATGTLSCDHNDYYAPGTGGVLGYYSGYKTALPIVSGVTGNDANSLVTNPLFTSAGGTSAANYTPASPFLKATPITGTPAIPNDFAGTPRNNSTPSMGAYDVAASGTVTLTTDSWTTTTGIYSNLKGAFDAINAGTHQGTIEIRINGSTAEPGSAVLNAPVSPANYASVKIYPTVTGLSITGSLAAPLIDLNGADNVTIDGRLYTDGVPGGTVNLTISNASTSSTAGTSTIRFINDASTNTVKYCTIKGSETVANAASTGSGTLFFSTGTSTGNTTNTITNNTITSAGANLPFNAIYSAGSSTSIDNSGISITNNNIQDYSGASPNGIYLASNSSAWTITGNRFFQTASRTISGKQRDINIVTASGVGYTINNNIIGYSSASGTGTSTFTGTANLIPIELTAGTSSASEIQGNTITAISFSTSTTTAEGSGIFSGISILAGTVNVGTTTANTIGAETGNGAITITPSSGTPWIQGIYAASTGTVSIQNNKIGSISVNGAATIGFFIYGINTAGAAGNFTISSNTIGSTSTANSIAVGKNGTTTSGVCTFYGINQAGTGTISITGNTIQNCSVYGTAGSIFWGIYNTGSTGTTAISTNSILNGTLQGTGTLTGINNSALPTTLFISTNTIGTLTTASTGTAIGIQNTGAATTANINGNIINTISSTGVSCNISGIKSTAGTTVNIYSNTINALSGSGTTSPIVNGINIGGGTTVTVNNNNIYNISQSGAFATTAGAVNGMLISAGTTVYAYNNFISELKAPAANIVDAVRGISITSTTANTTYGVYNNTVYLDASSTGTTFGSSGIYHSASTTATTSALDLRNNIIVNNSTPKGAGYTVAFKSGPGTANYLANYASTSNNNNFYAGTPGTYNVIYFDGTSSAQTLYAYKTGVFTAGTIAPRDAASITELPPFVNKSISPYDLRISTGSATLCEGRGSVVSAPIAITTDYYGTARYPNTGYPASASYPPSAPDMGAHEFGGTPALGLSGTVNVGTGQTYTSLTNAGGLFEAIYNNGIASNLTALIISDLTETGAVELTQWTGSSTLTISPTGGAARTISGTVNGAMISLKGADRVSIDGLNTGSNSLIISNLSTGTSASTIKFYNDATANTIKKCTVKGSSTNTSGGVIFFSTTTGTTGNDGNLIDNNNITNSVNANRPVNAIYALGTSGKDNSENTVSNNNIFDYINPTAASYGIQLGDYNSAWTISGNSLYETTSITPTGAWAYNGIYISSTGVNFTVSNNYIGGSSANCAGTWTKSGTTNNSFTGIYLYSGAGTTSNIQGNTIQNFTWQNSGTSGWTGIQTGSSGSVNIGTTAGNTIGSTTGSTSVNYTGGAAGATCYGISILSTGTVDCQNNAIGLITAGNSVATANTNFWGIHKTGAGTTTISNNTIGSTTITNSINVTSASTGNAQTVYGINSAGTGPVTISGNTISKLTNGTTNTTAATLGLINGIYVSGGTNTITGNTVSDMTIANANTAADQTASVTGIALNYAAAGKAQNISANTIYNLSNGYASFAGNVAGIYYNGSATASTVSRNFIYGLSVNSSSTSANIYGLKINAGVTTYSNNIISLGGNTATAIYGIWEPGTAGNNTNLYFNTVSISGALDAGATNVSYAFWSNSNASTRDFRNNIFSNTRSTASGSNLHFAVGYNYSAVPVTLTSDYNDYYVSGTGTALGMYYATPNTTLDSWKTSTAQDTKSQNFNPSFTNGSSTNALDYFPSTSLPGILITGFPTDFYKNSRLTPVMGALEQNEIPTPAITTFAPASAGASTTITITGTNLTGATAVTFGGTAATSFTVVSPTSITALVGSGTTGDVKVVTPIGTVTKNGFTWQYSDANLSGLTISSGTLSPSFASATITYTVSLANGITGFTVTPTANESHATITVNGTAIASGVSSSFIPLAAGANTISIVVTAQDGTTVKTYTITATRATAAPTLTTTAISSIGYSTASSGGEITSDGGSAVTASGVCWSTSTGPTTGSSKTTDGSVSGPYSSAITGLTANTLYYARAYATNAVGTTYGTEVSFTTNMQLTISAMTKTYRDAAFALINPPSNSVGAFSYSSGDPTIASVSGNTVTILASGTPTITVTQEANGSYASQSASATLTISKANQVITLSIPSSAPLNTFTGTSIAINATSSANLSVSIAKSGNATATLSGSPGSYTLTGVSSTGTVTFTADQAGDANYNAATQVVQSFDVTLGDQTITFGALSPVTYPTATTVNLASAASTDGTGELAITYNVVSGPATILGNTLTISGSGIVRIKASQAGNSSWNPAPDVYQDLTVNLAVPTITGFNPASGAALTAVTITGTNFYNISALNFGATSANTYTVSSSTQIIANVSGGSSGNVTVTTPGGTATRSGFSWLSGDATLSALAVSSGSLVPALSSSTFDYSVNVINATTSFTLTPTVNQSNATITVNGTANTSGDVSSAVTLAVGNNTITIIVTVQDGTTTKTYNLTVIRAATVATLTTTAAASISYNGATCGGNITSDGASSVTSRGVCWSTSSTPTIADSKTTDGTGTGTFTSVISGLTGNTLYYARAYATNAIGTSYGTQVTFTTNRQPALADISKTYGDAAFLLVNPATNSLGAFSYTSGDANVAIISGKTVTINGAGTATITVTQAAHDNYASESTSATLTVDKAIQVLSLSIPQTASLNTFIGTSADVSASSSSGLTVVISKNSASTATATLNVPGSNYSLTNVSSSGTIIIDAIQTGNANYYSARTSQSFDVTKGDQTITFGALTPVTYSSGGTVDLSSAASTNATGGLSVSYEVVSGPATVTGTTISLTGWGVVRIKAYQDGEGSWNPAPNVYHDLTVNLAGPNLTSFTPASGQPSTDVTITGTNFYGVSEVSFGGTPANFFTVNSATQITARVGLGSSGNIVVTAAGGTATSATAFSYIGPPTITSFTPTSAISGGSVVITGTQLTGTTAVSFGGTAATSFTVDSGTQITALVASGTSGSVSVTNTAGTATHTGFIYVVAPSTQAASIIFSSTSSTQTDISLTSGNGSNRVIFMLAGSTGNAVPVNATTYTANAAFGSGTQIGTSGWYCVYNGTGSSLTVTGLNPGTTYRAQVFEYNGRTGIEQYLTSVATGNPNNVNSLCTNPTGGGTIAADQSGASPFDPALITSVSDPAGHSGILEGKWMMSTTSSTGGFEDISGSSGLTYNPASITQSTWYKRVTRVSCKSDWTGAAESNVLKMTIDIALGAETLQEKGGLLLQNYPNPFKSSTTIHYRLPFEGRLTLTISTLVGTAVKVIIDAEQPEGDYNYILADDLSEPGVYLVTMRLNGNVNKITKTIKMVKIR